MYQLVKKTYGLPQRCLDPVVVVLNEVNAGIDKLSLSDPNTSTDFARFLASGIKSGQAFATAAPHGNAGELTNHVRIARPAPKCQAVLKAEFERFRRDLYIQQLDRHGSLIPSSRAPPPLGRQITCRQKFDKLTWGANPCAH